MTTTSATGCPGLNSAATITVLFLCAPLQTAPVNFASVSVSGCSFTFTLYTAIACSAAQLAAPPAAIAAPPAATATNCGYNSVSFASLSVDMNATDDSGRTFVIHPCGAVSSVSTRYCSYPNNAQQQPATYPSACEVTGYCNPFYAEDSFGYFNSAVAPITWYALSNGFAYSQQTPLVQEGWISASSQAQCASNYSQTTFAFICNAAANTTQLSALSAQVFSDPTQCQYLVQIQTSIACTGSAYFLPAPQNPPQFGGLGYDLSSLTGYDIFSASSGLNTGLFTQLSFCLTVFNGSQTSAWSYSLRGVLQMSYATFTGTLQSPTGQFVLTSLVSGVASSSSGGADVPLTLLPLNSDGSDNVLTLTAGSNAGVTDGGGVSFAWTTAGGAQLAINAYSGSVIDTGYPSGGIWASGTSYTLTVAYYNASANTPLITCNTASAPVVAAASNPGFQQVAPYYYFINLAGKVQDPTCAAQAPGAMVCQRWTPNNCARTAAAAYWNPSVSPPAWSFVNGLNYSAGIQLSLNANASSLTHTGGSQLQCSGTLVRIIFVCSPTALRPYATLALAQGVSSNFACAFTFTIPTYLLCTPPGRATLPAPVSAAANNCSVTLGTMTYNFSSLASQDLSAMAASGNQYIVRPCQAVANAFCQASGSTYQSMICSVPQICTQSSAYINVTSVAGPYSPSSSVWSSISGGVQMSQSTGQACTAVCGGNVVYNGPRQSIVQFVCAIGSAADGNNSVIEGSYDGSCNAVNGGSCTTTFIAQTNAACLGVTWQTPAASIIPRRTYPACAYNVHAPANALPAMWMLGGEVNYTNQILTNDVWYSTDGFNQDAHQIQPTSLLNAPGNFTHRRAGTAVYLANQNLLWFGGKTDDPSNANSGQMNSVYYSTDQGYTWSSTTAAWSPRSDIAACVAPLTNTVFMVGGQVPSGADAADSWINTDGIGAVWTLANSSATPWAPFQSGACAFFYDSSLTNSSFSAAVATLMLLDNDGAFYLSTNYGSTFSSGQFGPWFVSGGSRNFMNLLIDHDNIAYVFSGQNYVDNQVYYSLNKGSSWQVLASVNSLGLPDQAQFQYATTSCAAFRLYENYVTSAIYKSIVIYGGSIWLTDNTIVEALHGVSNQIVVPANTPTVSWTQTAPYIMPRRTYPACAYNTHVNSSTLPIMFMLGGEVNYTNQILTNDVWYSTDGFYSDSHQIQPTSLLNAAGNFTHRRAGSAVFLGNANLLWFGGKTDDPSNANSGQLNSVYYSTDQGFTWSSTTAAWSPRSDIAACVAPMTNFVFTAGGQTPSGADAADSWVNNDGIGSVWTQPNSGSNPWGPFQSGACAFFYDSSLVNSAFSSSQATLMMLDNNGQYFLSTNYGSSFSSSAYGPWLVAGQSRNFMNLLIDRDNLVYAVSGQNYGDNSLYFSANKGGSWQVLTARNALSLPDQAYFLYATTSCAGLRLVQSGGAYYKSVVIYGGSVWLSDGNIVESIHGVTSIASSVTSYGYAPATNVVASGGGGGGSGLSGGAIAGIVIGSVVFALLVLLCLFFLMTRGGSDNNTKKSASQPARMYDEPSSKQSANGATGSTASHVEMVA